MYDDKHQKEPKDMSEVELFLNINAFEHIQWRLTLDADNRKRIPDSKYINNSIEEIRKVRNRYISELTRFGVTTPFRNDGKHTSTEYYDWFNKWSVYIFDLPQEEWEIIENKINNNEDTSDIKIPKE